MDNEKFKYGVAGLLIGGAAIWFLATLAVNSNNMQMMGMMGYRSANQTGMTQNTNLIDSHFIEQMIPHHEDAITMAKLAQANARHPEINQLAENIIDSQSKEISQMKIWYEDWFEKKVPSGVQVMSDQGMMGRGRMHMGMMGNETDMARFENAEDFDKTFIEEMIPHHQMAVMMANMLKGGTQRVEMEQLAENIITAQTDEINQMRQWYVDWGYEQ